MAKSEPTTRTVALFQVTEKLFVDVKKGKYDRPFLILQERCLNSDTDCYYNNNLLLTVVQWNKLKNNFNNIREFAKCVSANQQEMFIDLGEKKKLLTVRVRSSEEGVVIVLERLKAVPDFQGRTVSNLCIAYPDFEKLTNWTAVIDTCIRDYTDVPERIAITNPNQYISKARDIYVVGASEPMKSSYSKPISGNINTSRLHPKMRNKNGLKLNIPPAASRYWSDIEMRPKDQTWSTECLPDVDGLCGTMDPNMNIDFSQYLDGSTVDDMNFDDIQLHDAANDSFNTLVPPSAYYNPPTSPIL